MTTEENDGLQEQSFASKARVNAGMKTPQRKIRLRVTESSVFSRWVRAAFEEMERQGLDEVAIPNGMVLVRGGSAAEITHHKPGNVLYEKRIEGKVFFVCAS